MIKLKLFIQKLLKRLKATVSIGIITHKNPDGDGLPAALMLHHILKRIDIE